MTKRPTPKTTTKKKAEAPATKAAAAKPRRAPASKKSTTAKSERAPEPAHPKKPAGPQAAYSLDGAVPPEGAGLPKPVGALLGVAQQTLGIKTFRAGQAEAFDHLLRGEDLLAVMPTGSGKSLLYQLTSLVVPGVTVVVSPLIALIKDQLDKMTSKGLAAAKIDSTLTVKQRREVDALVKSPGGKLLLTTPERMADPDFRTFLRDACGGIGVSRFVVDEAHCVSQWGHDFRPAYLSLRKAIDDVGRPPVLATTATAPPHVRDDILFQLGMEKATIVTTTFDRPNLHYEVINFSDEDEKMKTLVTLLKKLPRPGIVYCATVKKVEELYEALTRWGVPVGKYHGRMNKGERDTSQNEFMASSELVMVATNAFGLGVDKANIRNVLHYHVPGSLESYAQEAGRGGRDGKASRCVLLFSPDDVAIQEYFLSGTYPTKRQVRQVYETLQVFTKAVGTPSEADSAPTVMNVALGSSVGQQRTRTVLSLLKDEKFIIEKDGGTYYVADPPPDYEDVMERARQYEARRIADRQRLDALLAYVKTPDCRNRVILDYLGEPGAPKCGRCDNCLRSKDQIAAAAAVAARLGSVLMRELDDDGVELPKPKREIKARTVRIDQPPTAVSAEGSAPVAAPAPAPTVMRRAKPGDRTAEAKPNGTPPPPAAPAPTVMRRAKPGAAPVIEAPPVVEGKPAPHKKEAPAPGDDGELDEDDDELEDETDLDEDDDLDDDDDDLDDDDDDDEDDDDDDLDDDDDFEVIDKTAAELAEEGIEGPGEITVLARKRVPKQPKQRPQHVEDTSASATAAEARRRRRRRRRKRRAMLPPKSAFLTPVLSTAAPLSDAQPRRGGGAGGPVIEYVRGPMRIAMAPVASANPNDAGVGRRRGKKQRRWERGPGGPPPRRFEERGPAGGAPSQAQGPNGSAAGANGPNGDNGERRRRRRRRRRRGGVGIQPGAPMLEGGNGQHAGNGAVDPGAPVSFFEPNVGNGAQAPQQLGPDGQPLRKRRRRRRRGRGGRNREWRAQTGGEGGGEGGAPPGDGGGGGGEGGGEGGGGGSFSDGE
ncbi:MAG TPA: ATP-dependent DNA helicase RecQ [Kofleriaceae bacterium]|nr:ATP-dependent DNA helicase RecQ [Kofleriaceae bacterium]